MSNVQFKRGDDTTLAATDFTAGLLFFNSSNHSIYLDDDTYNERKNTPIASITISDNDTLPPIDDSTTPSCHIYEALYCKMSDFVDTLNKYDVATPYNTISSDLIRDMVGSEDISEYGSTVVEAVTNLQYMAAINSLWQNNAPFQPIDNSHSITASIHTPIRYRCFTITYATYNQWDNIWTIHSTAPLSVGNGTTSTFILTDTEGDTQSASKITINYPSNNNLSIVFEVYDNTYAYVPLNIYGVARYV